MVKKDLGKYKIQIKKFFDKKNEKIIMNLIINDKLKELINYYACKDEPQQELNVYGIKTKRYLFKQILKNSIYWYNSYSLLFVKKLLEKGEIKINFERLNDYAEFIKSMETTGELIRCMEELKRKDNINVEFNLTTETNSEIDEVKKDESS